MGYKKDIEDARNAGLDVSEHEATYKKLNSSFSKLKTVYLK